MSEPKLIQPLLAEHIMGEPISDHHGVRCCPAMHQDSDSKYIVKIISIPASQIQLDALLLSGAYSRKEDALNYFRELADDTVREAELLQRLSRLEGFAGYEGWQVVPMEDGIGYDVYLLGPYRPTLERHFRRNPMTHLGAVNLGLDLCAALSVSRRNGYLYVDLKPGNIHITPNQEYRIGDLGFISLASLKYASLPDKYRSAYTAPEITDAYSSLNDTIDIYAAGLILYQAYNNGELPFDGCAPAEPLPPPAYADYEMAEIILKACAPDPLERWQDPMQMGQALVSYMQRNSVNDTPIIPIPEAPDEPEEPEVVEPEISEAEIAETAAPEEDIPEEAGTQEPSDSEPEMDASMIGEIPAEDAISEEDAAQTQAADEQPSAEEAPEVPDELPDEAPAAEEEPVSDPETEQEEPEASPVPEETESDDEYENLSFFDDLLTDETLPTEESAASLSDAVLSEEISKMLAQADALIEHKIPNPVVAPEPIDIPIPPLPQPEPEESEEPEQLQEPEETEVCEDPENADTEEESAAIAVAVQTPEVKNDGQSEEVKTVPVRKSRKKIGIIIAVLVVILLLLSAGAGGYYYYQNYYLQAILDIAVDGQKDSLTVTLDTQIDNSLLTVYCTDSYGNKLQSAVENNTASFTDLRPDTNYKVTVEISGRHQLIGKTTSSYTTAAQTNIISFTAIAGDRDGSVILNFSVQGPENTAWRVRYSAPGQEEQVADCTGHMAAITDLTVGSTYTFRLEPVSELYVVGADTLEYTACKVVYPEDLTILGFNNGALRVTWNTPEGAQVESWTVRCYNSDGYDNTVTVTETSAVFENLDTAAGYTIDVKAAGMSVSGWTSVSANSVTFKDILLDGSTAGQLIVSWQYEGTAPADGWRLLYTVDGSQMQVIHCDKNTCTITPLVPGAHYSISFDLPDGITVFGGNAEYDVPEADTFSGYRVSAENMHFKMCRRPDGDDWDRTDVKNDDYTTEFTVGESASFVVRMDKEYDTSSDVIENLFVVRDANGVPVSVTSYSGTWTSMWYKNYCEMDMPVLPQTPGSYTVEIYLGGMYVTTQAFTVA